MLRRLCLLLTRCGDIRNKREVDIKAVLLADLLLYLTYCFKERCGLNITYRTADFRYNNVGFLRLCNAVNPILNFIRYMRNYLNGSSLVVAAAFL